MSMLAVQAQSPSTKGPVKLPYVYTKWRQFTTAEGLPNDHIFAVKADGPKVWVGTEDGLACIDKRTGKIQSWGEKDGLPFKVVTALEIDKRTGDLWLGMFGGGLARFSGGRFDHWNQLNSGLANDVVYGVSLAGRQRLGGHDRRLQPFQHQDRRMDHLQREKCTDGGDLELRRSTLTTTRSIWRSGAAACSNTT